MLTRYAIAGVAGSALLASVAFAQSPSTNSANTDSATKAAPATASDTTSFKGNWRASKLVGLNVYNDSNESLGSINDLLTDKSGDIKGVVIGVGGFLGVGEKNVAVPFEKLNVTRKPESASIDKITVSYSKDELKNAPKFAYFEPGKPTTTGSSVTDKIKSMNPMNDSKK
jgi:ribosomal 30S subunit maturation factor RimM